MYGLDRQPLPLPAIQQLLGHADIATTTIYTRVSADDLARMMVCLKYSKDKLR
jgi:site-specific recombinase XerD